MAFIFRLVNTLHGYACNKLRHALYGEALQVAGYTGYILDTLVRHDVRVFSLVHYRVLAWVKFLHQTEATRPCRDAYRLFFQCRNLLFGCTFGVQNLFDGHSWNIFIGFLYIIFLDFCIFFISLYALRAFQGLSVVCCVSDRTCWRVRRTCRGFDLYAV